VGRPNRLGQAPSILASSPANRAQGTDVIMVPSQSVDPHELAKIQGVVYYEERSLFPAILLLRNPSTRIAFLSSIPVDPEVLDYYLELIATPRQHSGFRKRILMLSCEDPSCEPLSSKLLKRPDLVEKLRKWMRPCLANMRCILSTKLEVDLAAELNIPLLANDPQFSHLGTKDGRCVCVVCFFFFFCLRMCCLVYCFVFCVCLSVRVCLCVSVCCLCVYVCLVECSLSLLLSITYDRSGWFSLSSNF
jgi:hypothetical protein